MYVNARSCVCVSVRVCGDDDDGDYDNNSSIYTYRECVGVAQRGDGYSWWVSRVGKAVLSLRRRRWCEGYVDGGVKIAANRDNNRCCWSLTFIFYTQ